MNNNEEFTLTLNVSDLNTIAAALSEAPYKLSAPILKKIDEQLNEQVAAANAPAEVEADAKTK